MSYYTTIENLPLVIWEKCIKGDLTELRINQDEGDEAKDSEVWQALNYEYMETFGVDRTQQKYAQLKKGLISAEMELLETGNRMLLNNIRRIKSEMKSMIKGETGKEGMSVDQSLVYLSKFMGFFLQKQNLMTKQYFILVQQYGKAYK